MVNIPRGSHILFLDDMKERHDAFLKRTIGCMVHWAKTAAEAISMMEHMTFDGVFLDHDLQEDHYCRDTGTDDPTTGYHVAKWMRDNAQRFDRGLVVVVHSLNPGGRRRMLGALADGGLASAEVPFDRLLPSISVV